MSPPSASLTRRHSAAAQAGRRRDERHVFRGVAPLERFERGGATLRPAVEHEQGGHEPSFQWSSEPVDTVWRGRDGLGAGQARPPPQPRVDAKEAGEGLIEQAGPPNCHFVAAIGRDEQPAVGELAREPPGVSDRNERVAIATGDQDAGASIRCRSRGTQQGLDGDVGRDRRQEPPPGADALALVVAAARTAAQAGSSRSARAGSISRRATEARGSPGA